MLRPDIRFGHAKAWFESDRDYGCLVFGFERAEATAETVERIVVSV